MIILEGKYNKAKIFTEDIDKQTESQIINMLNQKALSDSIIRFMPDCHASKSSVVGTVLTYSNYLIPSLLGNDIGCGVLVTKLKEKRIDLPKFDSIIRKNIASDISNNYFDYSHLACKDKVGLKDELIQSSIGTLGGGNHFISIEKDSNNDLYLIIHTGSRIFGNIVSEYYKNLAFKLCEDFPFEFSFFEKQSEEYFNYFHDVNICIDYAVTNRYAIRNKILKKAKLHIDDEFDCIHNYIDETYIRKGAISAKENEKVIIPLNMADGSIYGTGIGCEDWLYSGPHGAGRKLSRKDAKNSISMVEYKNTMKNIYSTSVNKNTIDEAPQAYKNKDDILKNIQGTIKIIDIFKPIYNFKVENNV